MAWPDIVSVTIAYLDGLSAFDGVTITNEVPSTMPSKLLQVRRVGGTKAPPVRDRGRLDLIAWADTSADAMALALLARTHINALRGTVTGGTTIYLVEEFLGPRQMDDPLTGKKRVMQTQTLTFRAEEAIR